MTNIKLKSIVSEIVKEIVNQHPEHKKINDKLMQIAKRDLEDKGEKSKDVFKEDSSSYKEPPYEAFAAHLSLSYPQFEKLLDLYKQTQIDSVLNAIEKDLGVHGKNSKFYQVKSLYLLTLKLLKAKYGNNGWDDSINEGEEKEYVVTFWVMNNDDKDDYDETVKASSSEEAIEKVKKGAPRLARNFTAKLK
jgi:hypothetical protein